MRDAQVLFVDVPPRSLFGMTSETKPDSVTTLRSQCEPLWEPLEKLLPLELVGCFMAMYQSATHEGPMIHAYKHIDTRRYLFLDEDSDPWCYTNGEDDSYCRVPLGTALEEAFCGWADLHGYEPELGKLVAEEIARARAPRSDDDP
jgi:hypothetical protein